MTCTTCQQLRAQAKEQARKLQLKRLAQTAAQAARHAIGVYDSDNVEKDTKGGDDNGL